MVCVEKEAFESNERVGKFSMPAYEHAFLIDLAQTQTSSEESKSFAYVIQAAFATYGCYAQRVTSEFVWRHLDFLNQFDRKTVLNGEKLSDWINHGVFLNRNIGDLSQKSFAGKNYIGQIISFTSYSYNPNTAISRLNMIKSFRH